MQMNLKLDTYSLAAAHFDRLRGEGYTYGLVDSVVVLDHGRGNEYEIHVYVGNGNGLVSDLGREEQALLEFIFSAEEWKLLVFGILCTGRKIIPEQAAIAYFHVSTETTKINFSVK